MIFLKKITPFLKYVLLFCLLISTIALAATFSRGGWVSTMAALLVIVCFYKKWHYFWYFIGFVVAALIGISVFIPEVWELVFDRFASIFIPSEDASSSARVSLIKASISMWKDHPIVGVGLRGFPEYYYTYIDPDMPHALADVRESHTLQTEILAEQGLVGFSIAVWLFFTIVFHAYRSIMSIRDDFLRNAEIVFLSLFFGFMANFVFSSDLYNNTFWVVVGMLYTIPLIEQYASPDRINVPADT
jgi:O-antigen ligase